MHPHPPRRPWLLVNLSLMLLVAGLLMVVRSPGPETDLSFALGLVAILSGTLAFRAARTRLVDELARAWQAQGASEPLARERARAYVDDDLLEHPPPLSHASACMPGERTHAHAEARGAQLAERVTGAT